MRACLECAGFFLFLALAGQRFILALWLSGSLRDGKPKVHQARFRAPILSTQRASP